MKTPNKVKIKNKIDVNIYDNKVYVFEAGYISTGRDKGIYEYHMNVNKKVFNQYDIGDLIELKLFEKNGTHITRNQLLKLRRINE